MKNTPRIFRETRFRLPGQPERDMALWVDRIGAGPGGAWSPGRLRLLGQYAAVAVDSGRGKFFSPAAGHIFLAAGDVLLLFPGEPSRYEASPNWQTRWIVWNGPEAEKLVRLGGFSARQPVVRGGAAAVRRMFTGLEPLMQAESFAALLERKSLVLGLVADLVRIRQAGSNSSDPTHRIT
ncbi:MAG: AraC family ligand binding domain-containing protein, partial [bacterium]